MRIFLLIICLLSIPANGAKLGLQLVVDGLMEPVEVVPQGGALYIVEQAGRIRKFQNGKLQTVLDIQRQVKSGGERGLLSLAFHPGYKKNKRYFVNYTTNIKNKLNTVVSEFIEKKERRLLNFVQPYSNHNGGQVAFGPDGYLYIAAGDGGFRGDPHEAGERLDTLLGKILRIDVDSKRPYAIPKDNPYQKGDQRGEIFAYGLRNPWRFSFDPKTKRLFTGDVGQNKWEEIDIIEKGKNYGWNTLEGTHCFDPATGCSKKGRVPPIFEYPQPGVVPGSKVEGMSVTGGFVYRGKKIPSLDGVYIFADYVSRKIWGIENTKGTWRLAFTLQTEYRISSFGLDNQGELLVVDHGGAIYRLVSK